MDSVIITFLILTMSFGLLNFYVSLKAKKELKTKGFGKSQQKTHMRVNPKKGFRLIDILNFQKDDKEYVFIVYAKGWFSTKMLICDATEILSDIQ